MVQSFESGDTLSAQRIICLTTAGLAGYTVTCATAGGSFPVGISNDSAKTGQGIPVSGPGEIARLIFNDTVNTGALVGSDTNGKGIPFNAATATAYFVGILVSATIAATGTYGNVYVCPGAIKTV